MREQLLGGLPEPGSAPERRRFPRLRGGDDATTVFQGIGACALVVFLIFYFTFSSLAPHQYGLYRSYLTGSISHEVQRGGIYFTGPFRGFIKFPATQQTLIWSSKGSPLPIKTRTGADPKDPDSGGQPIAITCAVQYLFVPETLPDVYLNFAGFDGAQARFELLAGNMVSNTAQEFTPQAFWRERSEIATRMLSQINATLWEQGALAVRFEIMKVDFATSFEDSITKVQVAEQQRVIKMYEQQVQQVVQSINVLEADNQAFIANISAGADADAKEICAGAQRDAFHLKQARKAQKYRELQEELGLTAVQMQEYFKIKSVQGQGQSQGGKVVVGLPQIGGAKH